MIKVKYVIITLLVFSIIVNAQFDIDKFRTIDFTLPQTEVKSLYPDAKWEERTGERGTSISFYDWLEPSSIRVSFSYNTKNELTIKTISNGKRNEIDAKKFYTQIKQIADEKFGGKYEEKSFFNIDMMIWKSDPQIDVLLTKKGDRASLIIAKKGSLPMI
ncbi:MAG: hypothetical protein RDU14_04910 [Melioribacteraceae bacterium]|nr:hypothetical protein [Melioribacteraceae bacterium]